MVFSDDTFNSVNSELRELPPIELSTLPLILKVPADLYQLHHMSPPVVPLELLIFFFVILAYLNGDLIVSFLHYKYSLTLHSLYQSRRFSFFVSTYADC